MWRINSPVAGMKAPCLFLAQQQYRNRSRAPSQLFIVQQASRFSKGIGVAQQGELHRAAQKNREPSRTRRITKGFGLDVFHHVTELARSAIEGCPSWLKLTLIESVEAEARVAVFSHIALEHRRVGLAQIDDYQSIDHIREFAVEVEAHQSAADLGILPQKNGQSFAILLHIGDRLGQLVKIVQCAAKGAAVPAPKHGSAEGSTRMDEIGKLAAGFALLKITDNHLARHAAVFVADADGSE